MSAVALRIKTLALESGIGRFTYAGVNLVRARLSRDPYARTASFLRAWRASSHPRVTHQARAALEEILTPSGQAMPLRDNPLLRSFAAGERARAIRSEFARYPVADRVRMRYPREVEDPARQGDLIILKEPDVTAGEKGVLLIKYTEAVSKFAALFEVEKLVESYTVVMEPSWWGYQDVSFFMFSGSDAEVIVEAQAEADFEFLGAYGFGLIPTRLGAGDWVDPTVFSPSGGQRDYDVVMVSSWNPFKRHSDLFGALSELREKHGRTIRTALVGYPNGWTREHIRDLMRKHDLTAQCDVFDSVTPAQVADIVSRSRLYVLLSEREGANKAMYEAMFCDTPVLAPRAHRGINHDHLNARTGAAFDERQLSSALLSMIDRAHEFSPRAWAIAHTGFEQATARLNELLAEIASRRGSTWVRPIVPKKNQPNLRYASEADRLRLDSAYNDLIGYLRPVGDTSA